MTNYSYKTFLLMAFLSSVLLVNTAAAEDSEVESLSVEIRQVLQKEMGFIETAMKDILSANAVGDLAEVAAIAGKMKESFILKQSLSSQQKKEVHTKLPSGFLRLDQEFHYMSGMLANVAANKKSELVGFYYSKLFESCANCHKLYAKHKFTHFSADDVTEHKN